MFCKRILGVAMVLMASVAWAGSALEITGIQAFREMLMSNQQMVAFFVKHPEIYAKVVDDTTLQQRLVDGSVTLKDLATKGAGTVDIDKGFEGAASNDLGAVDITKPIDAKLPGDTIELPIEQMPVTEGSSETKPVDAAPTPAPVVLRDINAPIEADKAMLDRGWPRYLNVPANCPAADSSKQYFHHYRHDAGNSGFGGGALDVYNGKFIMPFEGDVGGQAKYVNSTDSEVHAIPLNFPDKAGKFILGLMAADAPTLMAGDTWRVAVSTCPGTFGTEAGVVKSGGEAGIADLGLAIPVMDGKPLNGGPTLKAGERYYLNIKTNGKCNELANGAPTDGSMPVARRGSNAVCASIITPSYVAREINASLNRPYAGPCMIQGPFPENYNSYYCQGSRYGAENTSNSAVNVIRWRCNDVKDKHGPTNFEVRKVNGTWTWTLGANKAVYADSVCARDMGWPGKSTPIKSWDELDPLAQ